ncbi:hypothetical protein [Marinitenerispora sediminis]|uniref:Uncharacterized protein n=1 Tax=Marinitenerispora sediminis TaxID=1931232 RepID=A0A368SYG5_9ACTN|nr:hypothetical protein [Marinitenerispora sediminis]RCV48982.1 hypothetical protein DEF24_25700 [Marinitenerispora sediminis]RCV53222.1 hypothetical protein DEF28_10795 [Marinitenerispora sediminis]
MTIVVGAVAVVLTTLAVSLGVQLRQALVSAGNTREENLQKALGSRGEYEAALQDLEEARERRDDIRRDKTAELHKQGETSDKITRILLDINLKKPLITEKLAKLVELGILKEVYAMGDTAGVAAELKVKLPEELAEWHAMAPQDRPKEMTPRFEAHVESGVLTKSYEAGDTSQLSPQQRDKLLKNLEMLQSLAKNARLEEIPGRRIEEVRKAREEHRAAVAGPESTSAPQLGEGATNTASTASSARGIGAVMGRIRNGAGRQANGSGERRRGADTRQRGTGRTR